MSSTWHVTVRNYGKKGMNRDIDPRDDEKNCYTVSDKGFIVAGGVLEAICGFENKRNNNRLM